jgi:hypothetical protein
MTDYTSMQRDRFTILNTTALMEKIDKYEYKEMNMGTLLRIQVLKSTSNIVWEMTLCNLVRSFPAFQRNELSPLSVSKSKTSKQPARAYWLHLRVFSRTETEEGFEKNGISIWSRKRRDFIYREVKKAKKENLR